MRIMLVGDILLSKEQLDNIFRENAMQAEVSVYHSGVEALVHADHKPDLAILDLNLLGKDALLLSQAMKKESKKAYVLVIAEAKHYPLLVDLINGCSAPYLCFLYPFHRHI